MSLTWVMPADALQPWRSFTEDILTGLGTDGYTQDVLESYKVANVLHKHHLCDANAAWG